MIDPDPESEIVLPDGPSLLDLRRQYEALQRAEALRRAYGLDFYRPHWKQHKFHVCDATARYGRTGNRFGKSEMGDSEDVAWCLGGRIWYKHSFDIIGMRRENGKRVPFVAERHVGRPDHPYITRGIPKHPVKGLLLVVNWDKAKEIHTNRTDDSSTCGKLWKLIPHDAIGNVHLSRGGHVEKIEIKRLTEFGGGVSTLTIRTVEGWKHNEMSGESGDYDFIHVDEPLPEKMFKSFSRGLIDRKGRCWFTCTPLDEMWINDYFTPPAQRTLLKDETFFEKEFEGIRAGSFYQIDGEIFDNPHMDDEAIANFATSLTEEERQCRLKGLPLAMAGMVYKEFRYDTHVLAELPVGWEEFWLPPLDYTIRVAWDVHGARLPQAVMFAATAPTGDVFIYDELFCEPLIKPNAKLVKEKLRNRHVVSRIIDPRALIVNPVTRTADVIEAIQDEDLWFDPASKDLTTGVSAVKEKLKERNILDSELPTIFFSPRLKQTLFEFTHYVYDTDKNEPKDEHNHMMENLYRLVLNGLEYVEPPSDADFSRRRSFTIPSYFNPRSLSHAR